jgi:hypothetical protein
VKAGLLLLSGAAVVAGAEATARALSPRLPAVRLWHDPVAQLKVEQMERRRRRGATGGVVFAGSSQVLEGVRPSVAAPGLGLRAYNAALHRGFLPLTERWLLEEVLPRLAPRLVVLGIGVLDLTDNGVGQYEVVDRFEAAIARRSDRAAVLRHRLLRESALLRHGLATTGSAKVVLADLRIGPEGEGLEFAAATEYRLSEKKRAYIEDELLADYRTGPRCLSALERIVAGVLATGSRLVLVQLPHTEELLPMLPGGPERVATARSELAALAERCGVRLVDDLVSMSAEQRLFADCIHLNGAGMAAASARLAEALREELA